MMTKYELLDWLREEHQQWEALLDQIGTARMEQSGVNGDWSMKDMVAHMTGWNHRLAAHLQAALRGEPEPPPPWPAYLKAEVVINAWIYESNQGRPLREVLDEEQHVFQRLLAVIESIPDGVPIEREGRFVLLGDKRFPAGEFFDHFHDEHEADVLTWLARVE